MAKYLILIYGNEQRWDGMTPEEMSQIDEGHRAFHTKPKGTVLASCQLESSTMATTLRAGADGRPAVTDGPFLETKEVLGGFYLVEATDLDQVIAWASGLAEASHDHSGVEIVPLVQR